jgi:hypothetical protein
MDPNDQRSPFERHVCSTSECNERKLSEFSDTVTGETDAWVCSGAEGCQRKWNPQGEEIELVPVSIYLAGDWMEPPFATARAFEAAGCKIVHKWWEEDERAKTNSLDELSDHLDNADWFILDMRSPRFGEHYFAGSHIGLGMAHEQNAHIMVISPSEEETRRCLALKEGGRTYTSLLTNLVVDNEFGALEVLRQHRYDWEENDDADSSSE